MFIVVLLYHSIFKRPRKGIITEKRKIQESKSIAKKKTSGVKRAVQT